MKKKVQKVVSPAQLTQSRVDLTFFDKTSLPREKAITVMALLAGVSERAVRRQLAKARPYYSRG